MKLLAEAYAFVQDRIEQGVQAGDPVDHKWLNLRDRLYAAALVDCESVGPAALPQNPAAVLPEVPPDHNTQCPFCYNERCVCCGNKP